MKALSLFRFNEVDGTTKPIDAIGGISNLANILMYPQSSAEMRALTGGYGLYSVGYFCDDTTTPVVAKYGSPNLNHTFGTAPTYRLPGALGGSDYAIRLPPNGGVCIVSDGDVFDVVTANDLIVFWIAKHLANPVPAQVFLGKDNTGTNRWQILHEGNNAQIRSDVGDGVDNIVTRVTWPTLNVPYVGAMALSRSTNKHVLAWRDFNGASAVSALSNTSLVGDINGAGNFVWGSSFGIDAWQDMETSFFTIGVGAGYANGVPENMSTILANIANGLLSQPAAVSALAGRGRSFVALSRNGFEAADVTPGSTLLTRDASVQALVRWDLSDQAAAATWTITKTSGTGGTYDAGASTVQSIAGDGSVFFVAGSPQTDVVFGFNANDASQDYTDIDYGLFLQAGPGSLQVFEQGALRFTGGYAFGDYLEIRRIGTTVTYYKNGVLQYTSGVASSGALNVDSALASSGSSVQSIWLVDAGVRKGLTWKNLVNVTVTPTGNLGSLYVRGKATSVAEYINAGLELRVVNAALAIGELRWLWQTSAGMLKRQVGAQFTAPTDGSYILLTATRRWVSSTSAVIRYYLGGQLLSEILTSDGDIGGGATGTTTIGARFDGSVFTDFFDGVIDELEVVDYEMSAREVAATWARINSGGSKYTRMMKALLPPGRVWR